MSYQLHLGDCLDILPTLESESIDAIVTDPPYGLSFMGKAWDNAVPSVDVWRECLRVLKPGGHLLCFAGTRTQHRMATAIEDAGFEIRDMIAWVYGSGFPKSLDVSKAIDKMDAVQLQQARRYQFTEWVRSKGVTSAQIDEATGTNMGGHYTTAASQPAIMTREHLEACRHLFADVPEWVEREADIRSVESKQFAEREVVGYTSRGEAVNTGFMSGGNDITAPATPEAQQWDGWGTALKPALEPITVARKPISSTVAANVLQHGTGAINVDGCRVGTESLPAQTAGQAKIGTFERRDMTTPARTGRFPSNLITDGSDEVTRLFPETTSGGGDRNGAQKGDVFHGVGDTGTPRPFEASTGSAARFFYMAKASKRDRDEGCEGMDEREKKTLNDYTSPSEGRTASKSGAPSRNHHPTVKPTDLMRYLVRLVTPPGGVVLDPFTGSGSTGKACMYEGFSFIGCELDPDYIEIATARIEYAIHDDGVDDEPGQLTMFDEPPQKWEQLRMFTRDGAT